jgi:hypothetical protein
MKIIAPMRVVQRPAATAFYAKTFNWAKRVLKPVMMGIEMRTMPAQTAAPWRVVVTALLVWISILGKMAMRPVMTATRWSRMAAEMVACWRVAGTVYSVWMCSEVTQDTKAVMMAT